MNSYDNDLIKSEIFQGLLQVDSSFLMTSFSATLDKKTRRLKVNFEAETESGEKISEVIDYA